MNPQAPATDERTTAAFESLRPYLLRVAYSHLGSLSEAEDVVQEAWLRLTRVEHAEIRDLRAWLTTVVSRLALDALTSARARRERYVGPWIPEPLVESDAPSADPPARVELDESVSMALLIVLESLSPAERSAFLLHDVFGYSFREVARILERTEQASRQLAARARHAVQARRSRYPATVEEQREVVQAFLSGAESGDVTTLLDLLDPNVTFRSDGGGRVSAARRTFTGAPRVARIFTNVFTNPRSQLRASLISVNGAPGLLLESRRTPSVVSLTVDGGRIIEIDAVRNPEKLSTLLGTTTGADRMTWGRPARPPRDPSGAGSARGCGRVE